MWSGHHVSICGRNCAFTSKLPQFGIGICGKTLAVQAKTFKALALRQDCLEVPCVQEVLVISLDKPGGPKRRHTNTGVNILSYGALQLGPIVSIVTSHGQQNQF